MSHQKFERAAIIIGVGAWDVPLPDDMETLVESLLQEFHLEQGSYYSKAFQADLQSFLATQVRRPSRLQTRSHLWRMSCIHIFIDR